jgi:NAD(P)-dependent dehydrogenase (short-subunit alcohol dehydrogenase family)
MSDKVALITGSSSGFGLLTSIELAKAGFRVVATMRDLKRRDRLDQAATAAGIAAQLEVRALDVTNFDALPAFVDSVVRDHGRLDVLIASIAQDPNPKLRYLVGRDAKIQLALKRILPWKWHEKLVANFLKID